MKCWLHEIERRFLLNEKDPQKLRLKELEVDLVFECAGDAGLVKIMSWYDN